MASGGLESMIVEEKSEQEKPVNREKASQSTFHFVKARRVSNNILIFLLISPHIYYNFLIAMLIEI